MFETVTSSPFFGLSLTLFAFAAGVLLQRKTKWTLLHPIVTATAICILVLVLFDIPYEHYDVGASVIRMMLSPVTAILALGIYNQRNILKEYFIPVIVGCTAGTLTSVGSVLFLCHVLGVEQSITASLMPKSCTTPIALSIAQSHGGLAAIAATAVLFAGVTGAVGAPYFVKWFKIKDPVAQGLATGAASHALGTIKAREMGSIQGAMSSIAIGICGLLCVVLTLFVSL